MDEVFVVLLVVATVSMVSLSFSVASQRSRSAAAKPFLGVVGSTAVWLVISLYVAVAQPSNPADYGVWVVISSAAAMQSVGLVADAMIRPGWRLSAKRAVAAAVHPMVFLVVAAVPSWHAYLYRPGADGSVAFGPLLGLHAALMLGMILWTLLEVVRHRDRVAMLTPLKDWAMIVAWTAPVVFGMFSVAGLGPGAADLSGIGFAVSCAVMWVHILRPGFVDLQPIARDRIFERLADAVYVANIDGTVVDHNDTAKAMMKRGGLDPARGRVLLEDIHPGLATMAAENASLAREVDLTQGDEQLIAWVTATPVLSDGGARIGCLIQVRDVTPEASYRRELERTQRQLELEALANARLRAELSQQVVRDAGTGLFNRRYVDQTMPTLVERARSAGTPLSVAIMDIDHFKCINDDHGHAAGDRVLFEVAKTMRHHLPMGGQMARYGGEEFLVMLPGYTEDEAWETIEHMRKACAALEIRARAQEIRVTVSAGVASCVQCEGGADALIDAADDAMYRAKDGGRNRTEKMQRIIA